MRYWLRKHLLSFPLQIKDYACLYTSRASNLGLVSPMRPFRPIRDMMPHDHILETEDISSVKFISWFIVETTIVSAPFQSVYFKSTIAKIISCEGFFQTLRCSIEIIYIRICSIHTKWSQDDSSLAVVHDCFFGIYHFVNVHWWIQMHVSSDGIFQRSYLRAWGRRNSSFWSYVRELFCMLATRSSPSSQTVHRQPFRKARNTYHNT